MNQTSNVDWNFWLHIEKLPLQLAIDLLFEEEPPKEHLMNLNELENWVEKYSEDSVDSELYGEIWDSLHYRGEANKNVITYTQAELAIKEEKLPSKATQYASGKILIRWVNLIDFSKWAKKNEYALPTQLQQLVEKNNEQTNSEIKRNIFKKEQNKWRIHFNGYEFKLSHVDGLAYIAYLLANENAQILSMDLYYAVKSPPSDMGAHKNGLEQELHTLPFDKKSPPQNNGGNVNNILDQKYIMETKAKVEKLQEQLSVAKELGNVELEGKIQEEINNIYFYLSKDIGFKGHSKKFSTDLNKCRIAVKKRINTAIKKIQYHSETLGKHFNSYIKCGTKCSYSPPEKTCWDVTF